MAPSELVTAFAFLKERHAPLGALALGFIEINPGERRHASIRLSFSRRVPS